MSRRSKRKKKKTPSLPKPPLIQDVPKVEINGSEESKGNLKHTSRVRDFGSSPYVAIIALVLAIIGLPLAWEYYTPEITINEGVILDPANILSSAFQITNSGHFAVRSIEPCIMPDWVYFGNKASLTGSNHYLCNTQNYFPILRGGETKSLPLDDIIVTANGGYIAEATFRVRIHYKYFYVIPRTQYFGFRTFRDSKGVLRLFKEPS